MRNYIISYYTTSPYWLRDSLGRGVLVCSYGGYGWLSHIGWVFDGGGGLNQNI